LQEEEPVLILEVHLLPEGRIEVVEAVLDMVEETAEVEMALEMVEGVEGETLIHTGRGLSAETGRDPGVPEEEAILGKDRALGAEVHQEERPEGIHWEGMVGDEVLATALTAVEAGVEVGREAAVQDVDVSFAFPCQGPFVHFI
jgi:hypothetical protein